MLAPPDGNARPGLRTRLARWINRRIADPGFQARAAANPLTRWAARHQAHQLHDIVSGFVQSQTLFACVETDLLTHLQGTELSAAAVARRIGLAPEAAERLLQAAAALRLVTRYDRVYGLGPMGAALLGAPGVIEMVRHHALFYADLADPVGLLRGENRPTALQRYWSYVGGANTHGMTDAEAAPYSALMAASQTMVAAETLAAVPLAGCRTLLDIGGGEGAFLIAAAAAAPDLHLHLFDLPAVALRATGRFAAEGLTGRATVTGGSFLTDPLPQGADAASLVRVLYDHDDAVVSDLLARTKAALPPGGLLILSEPMSGGAEPNRAGDVYFGFYTAAMTTGRPRSAARHAELLAGAGFTHIRPARTRLGLITSVLTARAG